MLTAVLVASIKGDDDPRGVRIALTDKGRATIEAAVPGHVAQVRRFFLDAVSPKHLDVIANVSESVLEGMEEDGVDNANS